MDSVKINEDKVIQHLKDKWKGTPCPMCHAGNWTANNELFQLIKFHHGGISLGGSVIPVLPVTCDNCGNTILVNAHTTGLMNEREGS